MENNTGENTKYKQCQRSFTQSNHQNASMRTNDGKKPYNCQFCQKSCSGCGDLKRHMATHTGEKTYRCQFCHRSFGQVGDLKAHMRIHTGEKPYKCQLCQKSFTRGSHLKTHMRIHTGEKPHSCQICQKAFADICNLKVHLRIHTGEKPYVCQICQKSFAKSTCLKTHMRSHTGEKPYICVICNIGFAQIGSLKNHSRTHATEKQEANNKLNTKSSSSAKHFKVKEGAQTQDLQIESEVFAHRSDNFNISSTTCAYAVDKPYEGFSSSVFGFLSAVPRPLAKIRGGECLHISKIKSIVDRKASLLNSFGCVICDELLKTKKEYLEHCSSHRLSPPDDLAAHLC